MNAADLREELQQRGGQLEIARAEAGGAEEAVASLGRELQQTGDALRDTERALQQAQDECRRVRDIEVPGLESQIRQAAASSTSDHARF
eukprot:CAMPEP_0173371334 /NCGR_PEP_ID=MMETSP1144-20121109/27227_1 /TAXON_ID=483371 /ORGANISM="non described non described, Strain CCMP2298" /LENGTH=88 /DNA_ID=CAMNT_0014323071 /DNA_START=9 /DNA_END=272 /DNA_ORIENTATION=+